MMLVQASAIVMNMRHCSNPALNDGAPIGSTCVTSKHLPNFHLPFRSSYEFQIDPLRLLALLFASSSDHLQEGSADAGGIFDGRASAADLRRALQGDDPREISRSILQFAPMVRRPEVNQLLLAAWDEREEAYPDLNWTQVRSTSVKLSLAQVLGNADRDNLGYVTYVRSVLQKADESHAFDALIALGSLAYREDLDELQEMSRGPNEYLATAALAGLAGSNSAEGLEILREVAIDTTIPEKRQQLAKQLLSMPRPQRRQR